MYGRHIRRLDAPARAGTRVPWRSRSVATTSEGGLGGALSDRQPLHMPSYSSCLSPYRTPNVMALTRRMHDSAIPHSLQSFTTPLDCLALVSGCCVSGTSSLIMSLTPLRNPMVTRSPTASLRHRRVSHPPLHPHPHCTHTLLDFPWPPHLAVMWSAAVVHHAVISTA